MLCRQKITTFLAFKLMETCFKIKGYNKYKETEKMEFCIFNTFKVGERAKIFSKRFDNNQNV